MEMNKKAYRLVIFDVDGTLLDTSEGLLNTTVYTIKQLGYEMPSHEVLMSFVGPRIQDSLRRVYDLQGEELDRAAAIFRNWYKEGDVLLAKPYEGVYELLRMLKANGIRMAVATNKRQDFTDRLMERYGFAPYMDFIYGTDMAGKLTKADLIRRCVNSFPDITKEEAVMLGDSAYDAIAAREAGVDFAGVTYGFEFRTKDDVDKYPNVGCIEHLSMLIQ